MQAHFSERERGGLLLGLVLATLGCGGPTLRTLSAGRVGCSPGEMDVAIESSERGATTWVVTCRGVEYQCARNTLPITGGWGAATTYSTTDVACAPRLPPPSPAAAKPAPVRAPTAADQAAAAAQIERVRDGDRRSLRARLKEPPFTLVLDGIPNRDGTVELTWELPAAPPALHDACEPLLLIDGERRRPTVASRAVKEGREVVRFIVKTSLLTQLSASTRAAGRLCDDEWHLTDASRWVLSEYVARYQEDAGWEPKWTPPPCCAANTMPCACAPPR